MNRARRTGGANEREANAMSDKGNITLADLPVGAEGTVTGVAGDSPISQRLMEMGIVPGIRVSVIKIAPFGDPLQIRARGYQLAIRKDEAQTIEVRHER
jgi:Fe2+ transport system protein FeoA